MIGPRGALAVALAVAGGVLLALPSCEGLPDKTCFGEHASALVDDGGTSERCTTCLQEECCDLVGRCDERKECIEAFRKAHACLLEKGPSEESRCIDPLGSDRELGRQLYGCMRAKCGADQRDEARCGISSCNVDRSVVLFATPSCDTCINGSCCKEVNACYGDRRCKLATECILRECPREVGSGMSAFADAGEAAANGLRDAVCALDAPGQNAPRPGEGAFGACIEGCLEAFAPSGGTADDRRARCLAISMYTCGAVHGCGAQCMYDAGASAPVVQEDGGADAGDAGPVER